MQKESVGINPLSKIKYLPFVYVLMIVVIFILPVYSVDEYSILRNTTSQLGAQDAPFAWVMNVVFALLGIASIADGWPRLSNYWLHKATILIFGISLFLTALFQHAPIDPGIPYSSTEDSLHSVFATSTGFSFVFFAISSMFIETEIKKKIIAFSVGISATLLSLLIFSVPEFAGIWQRIMFIMNFAWIMYFLYPRNRVSVL